MISIIKNEEELENVVGGKLTAGKVVGIVCGVVTGAALLAVGSKFAYDVYNECRNKSGKNGGKKWAENAWTEVKNVTGWEPKSHYRQLVSNAADYVSNI